MYHYPELKRLKTFRDFNQRCLNMVVTRWSYIHCLCCSMWQATIYLFIKGSLMVKSDDCARKLDALIEIDCSDVYTRVVDHSERIAKLCILEDRQPFILLITSSKSKFVFHSLDLLKFIRFLFLVCQCIFLTTV